MLNAIEFYAEAGRKAGTARNQRDEARAQFQSNWAKRAIGLEAEADRPAARAAFDKAYTEARSV